MRLLALRAETMQGIRRLKLPCDDITPIGLWGSDMFLIGVNNEQFEVLRMWNVQTEDVTPASLRDLQTDQPAVPTSPSAGNTASGARSSATGASPATPRSYFTQPASPAASAPAPASGAAVTPAPAPAATTPAASAAASPAAPDTLSSVVVSGPPPSASIAEKGTRSESDVKTSDKDAQSNAGKLRMTVDGEHLYAEIKGGKIQLKDRMYDSLTHARDAVRREKNKVAVWEYFDEGVKAWRVLNRD